MRALLLAPLIAGLCLTASAGCTQPADSNPVVITSGDNAVMNRARTEARDTLPAFWAWVKAHPDKKGYALKVGFPIGDGGIEDMWVSQLRLEGETIHGRLANAPTRVSKVALGDEVVVDPRDVSDWMIGDGCLYGGFTTRAMLELQPPPNAAEIHASLCPKPLPSER